MCTSEAYKDSAETETIISIWNLDEPQVFKRELQVLGDNDTALVSFIITFKVFFFFQKIFSIFIHTQGRTLNPWINKTRSFALIDG